MRRFALLVIAPILLAGCTTVRNSRKPQPQPQPQPQPAARAKAPTATLIYTATELKQNALGGDLGVATVRLALAPRPCSAEREWLGDPQNVSRKMPRVTMQVPAGKALVLETGWSGSRRICLLGDHVIRPQAGAQYRITNRVDPATGSCTLHLDRKNPDTGVYQRMNPLPTLKQVCGRR